MCIGGPGEPPLSSRSLSHIIASSCLVSVQKIRAFTFTPSWVHLSMVSFSPRCSLCEPRAFQAGHCLLQGSAVPGPFRIMAYLCPMVLQQVWHGDLDSVRVGAAIGYSGLVQTAPVNSFPMIFHHNCGTQSPTAVRPSVSEVRRSVRLQPVGRPPSEQSYLCAAVTQHLHDHGATLCRW